MPTLKAGVSFSVITALLVSQQGFFVVEAAAAVIAPRAGTSASGNAAAAFGGVGKTGLAPAQGRGLANLKVSVNPGLRALDLPGLATPSLLSLPRSIDSAVEPSVLAADLAKSAAAPLTFSESITETRGGEAGNEPVERSRLFRRSIARMGRMVLGSPKKYFDQVRGRLPSSSFVVPNASKTRRSPRLAKNSAAEFDAEPDFSGAQSGQDAYLRLRELKQVLGDGGPAGKDAFYFFRPPSGRAVRARAKGLEGFLYSKLEFERGRGEASAPAQLGDYFAYLDGFLKPVAWTGDLRAKLSALRSSELDPREKNRRLNALLERSIRRLRSEQKLVDGALWGRDASIYLIFARGYNRLKKGRNFFDSFDDAEFQRIRRETGANAIWVMDMFEIGEVNRWGGAGGSPYALKGYRVKPELGGDAAYQAFVKRAARKDFEVRNIADYVVNHTSIDSDMLRDVPEGLLHMLPPQPEPGENLDRYRERILAEVPRNDAGTPVYALVETENYPEGGRRVHKQLLVHHPMQMGGFPFLYVDMAQIDYSRPEARDYRIREIVDAYRRLGLKGLRRDLAYFVLNDKFFDLWRENLHWELSQVGDGWFQENTRRMIQRFSLRRRQLAGQEFLEEMSRAIYQVDPEAFIFDEAYEKFEELSRSGARAYYDKTGLYDALRSRNPEYVRAALREASFRLWQTGGAGLLNFIGTHDGGEGNPVETFGRQYRAAAALTLLLRPTLIYNGTELGTGRERFLISEELDRSEDYHSPLKKMIPFDVKALINWAESDAERVSFLRAVFEAGRRSQDLFREGAMEVLEPTAESPIAAYSVGRKGADGSQRALIVAGNLADGEAAAMFRFGKPVLESFGAFVPRKDKTYELSDRVPRGDGQPLVVRVTGAQLLREGLFIRLAAGDAHILEVTELNLNAPIRGPTATAFGVLLNSAKAAFVFDPEDVPGLAASFSQAESRPDLPQQPGYSSWDRTTQWLTSAAILAFLPLQLPQIIKNFATLAAGIPDPISILPWMGFSTGIIANMLLLSYFAGSKEAGAARVQAVGVITSATVLAQIWFAGFMPAAVFWIILPTIVAGLTLNYLKFKNIINGRSFGGNRFVRFFRGRLWGVWQSFSVLAGLIVLPLVAWATFGPMILPGIGMLPGFIAGAAAGIAGAALMIAKSRGRLPNGLKGVWGHLNGWLATALFMFGPIAQLANNFSNPANIAGISLLTLLLATAGNALMLPRSVYVKDRIWFTGSFWAVAVGGWVVMLSMLLYGVLSPALFIGFSVFLPLYMALIFHRARRANRESFREAIRFLWRGKEKK